jgi:hypothetical protein
MAEFAPSWCGLLFYDATEGYLRRRRASIIVAVQFFNRICCSSIEYVAGSAQVI